MKIIRIGVWAFLILLFYSCSKKVVQSIQLTPGYYKSDFKVPFNFNEPKGVFSLPHELNEISGLTTVDSTNIIATINDEKSVLYLLDKTKGIILKKIDFGKSNDYEGITAIGKDIYISESNGNIKIVNLVSGEKTREMKTILSAKNNVEGAVYDPKRNRIILACKGNDKAEVRYLYFMDPETGHIDRDNRLSIQTTEIIKKLNAFIETFNAVEKLTVASRVREFSPSGIAIQPGTGHFYILSSRGSLVLILDEKMKPLGISFLRNVIHSQPEGICFSPDGTLYISNEGRGKKARIYKY